MSAAVIKSHGLKGVVSIDGVAELLLGGEVESVKHILGAKTSKYLMLWSLHYINDDFSFNMHLIGAKKGIHGL